MAEADWGVMADGVSAASMLRGVTSGFTPPNGGGTFTFGYNAQVNSDVAAGYFVDLGNFAPLGKGVSIRAAIKRGVGAGTTSFAPMIWVGVQSNPPSVNDLAYLLGLSDNDPSEIVLRKGALSGGLDPTASDVLAVSSSTFLVDTWVHLRLDVIDNPNGDVVLIVKQNDLTANAVTAPVWVDVPGISQVIDDALQILTGSAPLVGGFVGMGFQSNGLSRRGFFDHIAVLRQE